MGGPDEITDRLGALEERIQSLEALYGLIDLLALPGMLVGGASHVFDATQSADTIPAQASGFYAKEVAGGGLPIRWTRFPEPGAVNIAVLGTIPFRIELRVLHTPHVAAAEDLDVVTSEGERIVFEPASYLGGGVLEFSGVAAPRQTGLLSLSLSSTRCLEAAAGESRKLGLPFVQLRSRPNLGAATAV